MKKTFILEASSNINIGVQSAQYQSQFIINSMKAVRIKRIYGIATTQPTSGFNPVEKINCSLTLGIMDDTVPIRLPKNKEKFFNASPLSDFMYEWDGTINGTPTAMGFMGDAFENVDMNLELPKNAKCGVVISVFLPAPATVQTFIQSYVIVEFEVIEP